MNTRSLSIDLGIFQFGIMQFISPTVLRSGLAGVSLANGVPVSPAASPDSQRNRSVSSELPVTRETLASALCCGFVVAVWQT